VQEVAGRSSNKRCIIRSCSILKIKPGELSVIFRMDSLEFSEILDLYSSNIRALSGDSAGSMTHLSPVLDII